MSRSQKKGMFVHPSLLKKINEMNEKKEKKPIKTWSRDSMIIPEMISHVINVHNGRNFIAVYVTEQMIGHRLGEFSPTRIFKGHGAARSRLEAEQAAAAASAAPAKAGAGVAGGGPAASAPAKPAAGKPS